MANNNLNCSGGEKQHGSHLAEVFIVGDVGRNGNKKTKRQIGPSIGVADVTAAAVILRIKNE